MKRMIEFRLNFNETRFRNTFISFRKVAADTVAFFLDDRIAECLNASVSDISGSISRYAYAQIPRQSWIVAIRLSTFCLDFVPILSRSNSCFPDLKIRSISQRSK